jgi:chromate reductase, NAD(P)H dehydrogenase (quinone)
MITVISGTNRRKSFTFPIARQFFNLIVKYTGEEAKLLSLESLPLDLFHTGMYSDNGQSKSMIKLQNEYMIPADKFLFVMPEYNGGFPGVLKMFIDACSIREFSKTFEGKKVAMVGLASGRAGNLRGMDHLTGVMNYLGCVIMPNKLPISQIEKIVDKYGEINEKESVDIIKKHVKDFIAF